MVILTIFLDWVTGLYLDSSAIFTFILWYFDWQYLEDMVIFTIIHGKPWHIRGIIKKFSAPCISGYQRMKI